MSKPQKRIGVRLDEHTDRLVIEYIAVLQRQQVDIDYSEAVRSLIRVGAQAVKDKTNGPATRVDDKAVMR